nr:succinyl-CoA synthetase alpha subunit [Naematelia aurantialba]
MMRSLRPARVLQGAGAARSAVQRRNLSIHEYQSVQLLNSYGIPTPKALPAFSAEEAEQVAKDFGTNELVIKAQVLAGGRGKGHFDSGFQGGVQMVDSPGQAKEYASKMLGHKLITKQTGAAGRICNAVMLAQRMPPQKEYYAAILNDRARGAPVLVTSSQGGMNIEDVAHDTPEAIITTTLDFDNGISHADAVALAKKLGFKKRAQKNAANVFSQLYQIFKEKDATQIEINPLAELRDGQVLCMDAKFGFDDNADFRQKEVFKLRDTTQEDPQEVEAAEYGLNFIKLDGDIGCLVNGAGLAMATMDVLNLHGGSPANFLDVGGGATADAVKKAFELLLTAKEVRSIFVNIFGGIMRCDVIAEGIIKATKELELSIPLVVRLQGTKEAEAKQ